MSHPARNREPGVPIDTPSKENRLRSVEDDVHVAVHRSRQNDLTDGQTDTAPGPSPRWLRDRRHSSIVTRPAAPCSDSEGMRVPSEPEARIARALRARRAASLTGQIPYYWLLDTPGLAGVIDLARRLARAPGVPVLIQGERGAGIQELARLIHEADPTARQERLCTMTSSLIGPAEARGRPLGTLLIEDVETLRPGAQAWLEWLLANRNAAAQPLRIIAGSRKSAGELQHHEGLSPELVHALDVGRLVIPPLRNRPGDILKLARRFLAHHAQWRDRPDLRFSEAAERKLLAHTYPANVRELRNLVERAVVLTTSDEIGAEAIIAFDSGASIERGCGGDLFAAGRSAAPGAARFPTLAEMERDYLVTLIKELRGRRTAISRTMGVSYPTVLRKIALYGLDVRAILGTNRLPQDAAG